MTIGIPKEIMKDERRVSATPETVKKMTADGHEVLVETRAGEGAFFSDAAYSEAGAQIINDAAEIYSRSEVILKVKEPQFNASKNIHETDMMKSGQYIISFLHPAAPDNHEMVRKLAAKGIIGLTLDGIPRISRAQNMDALTSMSTCAGYKGILMAANDLAKFAPQIFCAVGMIKPINALVIGAGVGGLQAIATLKRLGAVIYAADIRPAAVEHVKSLGAKVVDIGVPEEYAVGNGGYALGLSDDWLKKVHAALKDVVAASDIIFLSALVPGKKAPILITEEMVKSMKPGSVIIDISIDQGGNCEITPPGAIEVKHGVTINGIKNLPGLLPESATFMFANNIYNLFKYLAKDGEIKLDLNDEIVGGILTTYEGKVVHAGTLEAMGE